MGQYVTPTGFQRKTLQEIRLDLEAELKQVFGAEFETSPESPNGYLVAMLAKALSSLQELGQEIYDAHNPASATGLDLDHILTLVGMTRRGATYCHGPVMCYTGPDGASIPAGSRVMRQRGQLMFSLDEDLEISTGNVNYMELELPAGSYGNTCSFQFTFGTIAGAITGVSPLVFLRSAISTRFPNVSAVLVDNTHLILSSSTPFGYVTSSVDASLSFPSLGLSGEFTAATAGYQTAAADEVNQIVDSVDGWLSCSNLEPLIPGADIENDTEALQRFYAHVDVTKGSGTAEAIAAYIRDNVPGVTMAVVKTNRAMETDEDGRPGKSFEALVVGGEDADIGRAIFDSMAAGIQAWGNIEVDVVDGNGDHQVVGFSRPVPKYLWIKISASRYNEEEFPGVDAVKQAIMDWAETEYTMGKDVIRSRIYTPLGKVPGLGNVSNLQIAVTLSPSDTPSYGSFTTIPVGSTEYAAAAVSRMEVSVP